MATYELVQIPRFAVLVRDDRGRHSERRRGICTSRFCALVVAVALPIFAGACVPDDSMTPKAPSTLNAALDDVAHPALDKVSAWFSAANIVTLPIVPARCPFDATSRYFVCGPLSGGGLTLNQRFTLLDASNGKQPAFDAKTTTSLHLENAVAGTWSDAPGSSFTVDGQQVLDLTGLGTPRHTLNGTSLTLARGAEFRTAITNLVFPVVVAGAPPAWPLSGTIELRARSASDTTRSGGLLATMTFDGSSIVALTWSDGKSGASCRVNLTTMPPGIGCPLGSPDVPIGLEGGGGR